MVKDFSYRRRRDFLAIPSVFRPILALALVLLAANSVAQGRPPEWQDDLVDHLTGVWRLTGTVMGAEAHHAVTAEWALSHQFLRIHEKTSADAPSSERKYEAIWFLGYDTTSERYVLHLLDIFGGRYSETLSYGTRDNSLLRFVFEYPDGPFHTTFRWSQKDDSWQWLLEQKNQEGKWSPFADFRLTRATNR
jgi:hypothetical protein